MVVAGTFEKLVEQLACEEKPGEGANKVNLAGFLMKQDKPGVFT